MTGLLDWEAPPLVLSWLFTYAAHGTALLAATWLLTRAFRRLPDPIKETLWKFAVVGAVVTASLQVAWVPDPLGGHLTRIVAGGNDTPEASAPEPEVLSPPDEVGLINFEASSQDAADEGAPAFVVDAPASPSGPTWGQVVLLVAALSAFVGFAQRFRARVRLVRALRDRVAITEGEVWELTQTLAIRAQYGRSIRLSTCPGLGTPIAFGILRPEICIPERALLGLDRSQRAAMLGHELAHIARRDPLWLAFFGVMVDLFAWQPLLRVARNRYQEIAEYRCDARAAELTGAMPVAHCLLEVADWMTQPRKIAAAPLLGMAAHGSFLRQRVDRLLSGGLLDRPGWHRAWMLPILPAAVFAMTLALPGVGVSKSESTHALAASALEVGDSVLNLETDPAATPEALLELLDLQWTLLMTEVSELQELVAHAKDDHELVALWSELDQHLKSFATRRETIRSLILDRPSPTPVSGAAGGTEGGNR